MDATEIMPLTERAVTDLLRGRTAPSNHTVRRQRRSYPRWPFPGTVELWVVEAPGQQRHLLASSENLSQGGVGIRCDEHLAPGTLVDIALHEPERSLHGHAEVRHCTEFPHGYYLGLQFIFD